jgi:uncharacterized membrane protein YdbT with pleckstrin-like domain
MSAGDNNEVVLYVGSPSMWRNRFLLFCICLFLCLFLVGFPILVIWWLETKCTTLTVTNQRTTLRRGILSKKINEVWHGDVRNIQLAQSLLQRLFDVGTISISSAGQSGVEIEVLGMFQPYKIKAAIDQNRRRVT